MRKEATKISDLESGFMTGISESYEHEVSDENDFDYESAHSPLSDIEAVRPHLGGKLIKRTSSMRSKVVKRRSIQMPEDIRRSSDVSRHSEDAQDPSDQQPRQQVQYRIQSKIKMEHVSFLSKVKHCLGCWNRTQFDAFNFDIAIGENRYCGFDPTRGMVGYLSWSFRTSFAILFLQLSIGFFLLIFLFTILIMIIGFMSPTCFQPTFNISQTPIADAYALSWTTFTTVGFGAIYPSLGVEKKEQNVCYLLHFLCTFEAFVGVIWAGTCGAIIFGKVVRIRSLAPIFFSDPLTIRYGTGVIRENEELPDGKIPCPVLTFRLANLHNDRAGGELVDSRINVLAMFNEQEHDIKPTKPRRRRQRTGLKKFRGSFNNRQSRSRIVINEETDSGLCSQSHFYKLEVDTSDNPYFKRSWTVNHSLDQYSPLVIADVQKAIRINKGYWPADINNPESIRSSIKFDQIFVSLSGISVASADSVYAQHMYDYVDMNIGYKFVPLLYKDENDDIAVRFEFLNDVVEQTGGGGEFFITDQDDEHTTS